MRRVPHKIRRKPSHDSDGLVIFVRMARTHPAAISAFFILTVSLLGGCASRHAVADRRQPPPIQESPSATEESGKSTTTERASAAATSPAPAPKRAKSADLPVPVGYNEEGNASWYGEPFHGRRASNGEIYDMYKLTAAHRTLPFDTVVRVTNLSNGKTTTVRITDRGPFVNDRIIDLSFAAARQIDSVGAGVVPVRIELVSGAIDPNSGYFTVQVGAFRDHGNAERLRDRLSASYSPIFIQQYDSPDGVYFRVRVGRVSGEEAARQFGEQLRGHEGFTPFVVRLDEGPATGGNP